MHITNVINRESTKWLPEPREWNVIASKFQHADSSAAAVLIFAATAQPQNPFFVCPVGENVSSTRREWLILYQDP